MSDAPLVWRQPFTIRAYEVGPDERASVLVVADLFQEAAGEHARAADMETFDLGGGAVGTWVQTRLRLAVAERPAMREAVEVETWSSGNDGLRAFRDYRLRAADGRVLVRGTSAWLVMHVERRRPVRLPEAFYAFRPEASRALTFEAAPTAPDTVEAEQTFAVRRSDLDRVGHANNVRFLEWTLEALPSDAGLAGIDVLYRAEAVAGDVVVSRAGPLAGGVREHELTRASDGRTLALARTLWT